MRGGRGGVPSPCRLAGLEGSTPSLSYMICPVSVQCVPSPLANPCLYSNNCLPFHSQVVLPAVLEHLPEYINHDADLGRREKARGLFDALSHPLFKFTATFFCKVFAVVCATSKKVQATKGARVAAVQGLMNVMCTQLLHTMRHVIPGGWEESLGVDIGSSLIKGSRMKFLRSLIEDMQTRFKGTQWDGSATVEDWVEASSCSCERVFCYVTATDFGQTTERMCETL